MMNKRGIREKGRGLFFAVLVLSLLVLGILSWKGIKKKDLNTY